MRFDRFRRKSYKKEIAYLFACTLMFTGVTFSSYVVTTSVEEENARVAAFSIEGEGDAGSSTTITLGKEDTGADTGSGAQAFSYDELDDDEIMLEYDLETEPDVESGAGAASSEPDIEFDLTLYNLDDDVKYSLDFMRSTELYQNAFVTDAEYGFRVYGENTSETAVRYYVEVELDESLPGGVFMYLQRGDGQFWLMGKTGETTYRLADSYDIEPGDDFEDHFTLKFNAIQQQLEKSFDTDVAIKVHAVQID